jgi:hypothetical protein
MLKLIIIEQNPAAATALTWFGVIFLALVAATIVGVWIAAALRARRGLEGEADNAANPALEGLRRMRLVVRRSRKPSGTQAAVVSELEPDGESQPTGAGAQLETAPPGV